MPPRIRRNPNYPSPSSPYYRFGSQTPSYAFNWSAGQGGVAPGTRAGETRGLSGMGHTAYHEVGECYPVGNADILESQGVIGYPAFKNTALHRIPSSRYRSPPTRLAQPWPRASYERGALGSVISAARWQAQNAIAAEISQREHDKRQQAYRQEGHGQPMSGFFGDLVDSVSSAASSVVSGASNAVSSIWSKVAPKRRVAQTRHGAAMGDWPLVFAAGPERLTYGEMGTIPIWDGLSDNEKILAVGGVAVGAYLLLKRKRRKNPRRRSRRARR